MRPVIDVSRLEPLIGIEAWFQKHRPYALILRPFGFLVVEEVEVGKCANDVHLLSKFNIDTFHALKMLGASHCSIAGLKDSEALTSQYASCKTRLLLHLSLASSSATILPVSSRGCIERGKVKLNHFSIVVATREPRRPSDKAPNYYGYQRFGTRRPNSHILGLLLLKLKTAEMLEEMLKKRYPFQGKSLGDYEKRIARYMHKRMSAANIQQLLPDGIRTLVFNAFQAYLFNRVLSRLVQTLGDRLCKEYPRIAVPGCNYTSTLKRLGIEELTDLYDDVMLSEGINQELLCKMRLGSPPRETCIQPSYVYSAELGLSEEGVSQVLYIFGLKSGEYATVYLASHYKLLEPNPNFLAGQLA